MASLKSFWVTPRIENCEFWPPTLPEICTPGVRRATSRLDDTPMVLSWSPLKAAMAMPTSWTFWARRCAVTTISPKPISSVGWASWATAATLLRQSAAIDADSKNPLVIMVFLPAFVVVTAVVPCRPSRFRVWIDYLLKVN